MATSTHHLWSMVFNVVLLCKDTRNYNGGEGTSQAVNPMFFLPNKLSFLPQRVQSLLGFLGALTLRVRSRGLRPPNTPIYPIATVIPREPLSITGIPKDKKIFTQSLYGFHAGFIAAG